MLRQNTLTATCVREEQDLQVCLCALKEKESAASLKVYKNFLGQHANDFSAGVVGA
jgi:hypothetical protein